MPRTFRSLALAALATAALASVGAAPASAGLLVASAPNCVNADSSQVFSPWLDYASYFQAPDGGLENGGAGWALDGASVVTGNESYNLSGPGTSALSLPSGSSATTPTVCVGVEHPTMRFFARRTSGSPLSSLRVDVLFSDAAGNDHSLPIGVVGGSSAWQPSPTMVIVANLLPLLPGSHTPVAFRFVPQGGSWQVDDVYVDPSGSR